MAGRGIRAMSARGSVAESLGQDSRTVREQLADGTRIGRYVVLRDVDGRVHAVATGSVGAVSETDDGETLLTLPGGRMLRVGERIETVLGWLTGEIFG